MSPNAKFLKSQCRTCPPSISRSTDRRQFEPDEAIAASSAVSPCQARLSRASDHSRDSSPATTIPLTHRVPFTVPILSLLFVLCCCLSSFGLVRCTGAHPTVTGPRPQSHHPVSQQIVALSHSSANSSSAAQSAISSTTAAAAVVTGRHLRVRRLSIWRNPLTARLRNKLVPVRRQFVASSRGAPNSYLRLSHFVRNRLHSLGASLNDKLRSRGRSVKSQEADGSQSISGNGTAAAAATPSHDNSTDTDRLTRRNDDNTSWPNRIDTDAEGLNSSSKSIDDSALSPTLNVIDLEPDRTKIAHNILVVRKVGKPSGGEQYTDTGHDLLQTPAPVVISSELKKFGSNRDSMTPSIPSSSSTTARPPVDDFTLEFVPIKNNHRPSVFMSLAKWKLKNKDKVITSAATKVESTTASSVAPQRQQQQIASTRITVSSPVTSASTSKATTAKDLNSAWYSTTASLRPSPSTVFHLVSSEQWSSTTRSRPTTTTTSTTTSRPAMTSKFESTAAELTTREQWSTVSTLSQDDFWSSFATENPTMTTGRVTEFDLPVTRPTDVMENSSSEAAGHNGESTTTAGGNEKDAAWSEQLSTGRPPDAASTEHRSVTAAGTTTVAPATVDDDNSIELMKEFQHANAPTTAQTPVAAEDKGADKINFYLNNGQTHAPHHPPQHRPSDDGVVIFKNNHGRPRPRPISASRPTTPSKNLITARPPYVTDFYPTTISAKKPSAITVTNIDAHRMKQPDNVQSGSITVLDPLFVPNSFMQLPLNTTIVHKNLLVPMKEGRPKPKFPTHPTTHFPVYPVVAGVSNWQSPTPHFVSPMMTTSSPEILPINGLTTVDDFTVSVPTTPKPKPNLHSSSSNAKPPKTSSYDHTIIKDIIITASSTIDRFSTKKTTSTTTTTTPRPATTSTSIRPPSYPVPSQGGYVNAIYAPPMPVMMPAHSSDAADDILPTLWMRPIRRLVNAIAPNQSNVSFMALVRNVLYSLMVMLLPPLALLSTLSFL